MEVRREIESSARAILEAIPGEDPDRDGLANTPSRFASAFLFFTEGYEMAPEDVLGNALFEVTPAIAKEMVLVSDIDVYSLCEHHLVPFFGKCHIAYIPDPDKGKVVGLSKLPRLVNVFARRLQVQERLTHEIMSAIRDLIEPKGVAVIMECRHLCMEMRGVEKTSAVTFTRARCGLFSEDSSVWTEFLASLNCSWDQLKVTHRIDPQLAALDCELEKCEDEDNRKAIREQISPCEDPLKPIYLQAATAGLSNDISPSSRSMLAALPRSPNFEAQSAASSSNADDYRLYQLCVVDEFSITASIVLGSVKGPLIELHGKFSILDIGAGNGMLLQALCSSVSEDIELDYYAAYEEDKFLCNELKSVALQLGFDGDRSSIQEATFTCATPVIENRRFDVVLLSHSLYGTSNKEEIVNHAFRFVKPGGIALIFHRWENGGTLDSLTDWLTSRSLLHERRIFEVILDISQLDQEERARMSSYMKCNLDEENSCNKIRRAFGYIAVEPHSCNVGDEKLMAETLEKTRHRVSFEARRKQPVAVVHPKTIVAIQACLRAASLQSLGCGKVAVVSGGHSSNCFGEQAIVIDMRLWDHVAVDSSNSTVRVGAGANIGLITKECEKFGLAVPLGDRPGVGMGLVLQGGLNHLMRNYGLACDNLVRVVYITPDGHLRIADQPNELFPFRGAGTNFGIILEVTLQAHKIEAVLIQSTRYIFSSEKFIAQTIASNSKVASKLPDAACLDGFIYWESHDKVAFASAWFNTKPDVETEYKDLSSFVSDYSSNGISIIKSEKELCSPSQLFDRELYMTEVFSPKCVLASGEMCPAKLRSKKRCLLFGELDTGLASLLTRVIVDAPTKWSYIHFLHGGGAVRRILPQEAAFGCRDFDFAAVLTSRYPDGDAESEARACDWLQKTVQCLKPYATGVYGSDLGPEEHNLALFAFGNNTLRLANMKRVLDPLNVLGCGIPLTGATETSITKDPRLFNTDVVVLFCGRRCAGKDWLANIADTTLGEMLGGGKHVSTARISDMLKKDFAERTSGINFNRLICDREYKECHRQALCDFYSMKKAQDIAYDAKCYVEIVQQSSSSILLLTGMRDGLDYARHLAGCVVLLVKVNADEESKSLRGWTRRPEIDSSRQECTQDGFGLLWDLTYENNKNSDTASATAWVKHQLAPAILKAMMRHLPDTPQAGIVYKDLVGCLLRQPCGLSLCTNLFIDWLQSTSDDGVVQIDALLVPEALGYVFAGALAVQLQKPLILARKGGRLPGDTTRVDYSGSNIQKLSVDAANDSLSDYFIEVISGSIQPGQKILLVDDCLASGSTATALARLASSHGGIASKLVCVMEIVDLKGRDCLQSLGVETFSLMQFNGD